MFSLQKNESSRQETQNRIAAENQTRKVTSEFIENMGGKVWTDKKSKLGGFIVVGKDRTIVSGKCKGIPAISSGEFLQWIDS